MQFMIHDFRHGYASFAVVKNNGEVILQDGQIYRFTRCEETPTEYINAPVPCMHGYEFVYWLKRQIRQSAEELIISVYQRK